MAEIQEKLPGIELKRTEVQGDAAIAEAEAAECLKGKESVEADLSVAMPALNAAIKVRPVAFRPAIISRPNSLSLSEHIHGARCALSVRPGNVNMETGHLLVRHESMPGRV